MPRKEKQYHYLYKTTNMINNKFYVGMHSTSDLEDGYLGSGKRLRCSIRKYGKENFKFEILEFFNDRTELVTAEIELVNTDLIKEELCMNLKEGGDGGWTDEQRKRGTKRMLEIIWNDEEFIKRHIERLTKINNNFKLNGGNVNFKYDWTGKQHSEETKEKMSNIHKILSTGELNSQFGKCWITKDNENKSIKKEELQNYLDLGWLKGRKMK